MLAQPLQSCDSSGVASAVTSLDRGPGETWREAEARMFRLVALMMRGELPSLADFSPADRRRLGYLAEFAALLLRAPNKADLLVYAEHARRLVSSPGRGYEPWICEPVVPGSSPQRGPQLDALAAEWGFDPGLDVSRYRAEAPELLIDPAHRT